MANIGKVERYINERLEKDGALLFALIDPLDHPSSEEAVAKAKLAYEGGADAILIGGSTGVQGAMLDELAKRVKESIDVPLILFPGNISTITQYADAVYFMSLLNSRNPYWISQAQMLAAPAVRQLKIEPLPTGYIVCEPGGTVGKVGDANLIPRDKPMLGAAYALAAQYMGMRFALMDAGSAPREGHIPLEMIKAAGSLIEIPLIVAGGVRTAQECSNIAKAGGSIVHVGTAIEKSGNVKDMISQMSRALKEGAKKR